MVARHQPPPTVDVVRLRSTPSPPDPARHLSALAGLFARLIDVTCETDLLACARNTVLHEIRGAWIVFVDDEVQLEPRWVERLGRDLERANSRPSVACSVGASWQTPQRPAALDVAYRRGAIDLIGPFSEPSSESWTTDLEMQLRLIAAGLEVQRGDRIAR